MLNPSTRRGEQKIVRILSTPGVLLKLLAAEPERTLALVQSLRQEGQDALFAHVDAAAGRAIINRLIRARSTSDPCELEALTSEIAKAAKKPTRPAQKRRRPRRGPLLP